MLRAIGWLIKVSAFALVVLVAANYFKIGKRTVSDRIRSELPPAKSALELKQDIQGWGRKIELKTEKAQKRVKLRRRRLKIVNEEIPSSEREKLRALMRELNGPRTTASK